MKVFTCGPYSMGNGEPLKACEPMSNGIRVASWRCSREGIPGGAWLKVRNHLGGSCRGAREKMMSPEPSESIKKSR